MNNHLLIVEIAILLICVGLSGCNQQQSTLPDDNSNNDVNFDPITINKFKTDILGGEYPATVSFFSYAYSSEGSIISYEWSTGEEVSYRGNHVCVEGYGQDCFHTYYKPGEYTVTITVRDDKGNSKQESRTIDISSYAKELFIEENTNLPDINGLTYHEIWNTYEIISIQGGFC